MNVRDVRDYEPGDYAEWLRMRSALWPDQTEKDMAEWLARSDTAVMVAVRSAGSLCGFVEVGERTNADGCETSPIAYVEGWYVDPDVRRQRIGARLIAAAETFARSRGYRELGSDTEWHNTVSQAAHRQLGFEELDRVVLYRKVLST
ncbi:MAG TPA: GNAT family N-acetyltransferase [Gemmatimonadaceae bacterium]|nr:GNAT family N-acetyltransferase [Gemmatimonadaceae bacterium]